MRVRILGLLLLLGCSEATPAEPAEPACVDKTKIVEVVWGEMFEDFYRNLVTTLRADGWTCVDEPVRNAFGTRIGTRYTCTTCE